MKTVPQNDSYSDNQTEILSEYCGGCITTDEERCDFCIKNTWLYKEENRKWEQIDQYKNNKEGKL